MRVIFETERLVAREWAPDDAEAAFAIYGDPEVTRYLGATGEPDPNLAYRRERLAGMATRYAATPGYGMWALVERAGGDVIGGAGLLLLEEGPEVEIAYALRRRSWGHGYATEVARGVIEYGCGRLGLPRLVGLAYPANLASQRVLLKAGMIHRGRRQAYGHDLEWFEIERDA